MTKEEVDAVKKKDYEQRSEAFRKAMAELSAKYRIDIVPVFDYQRKGIVPLLAFVDVKEKYESNLVT